MSRLHKIALDFLKLHVPLDAIALNCVDADGRMCVVPERAKPVPIHHRALLAFGSTFVLLCEAWEGAS